MTPAEEARRAAEAQALLGHPLHREACEVIEGRLIVELAKAETTRERAEHLRMLLIAGRKYRGYLEQIVATGRMVEFEEERKRTLRDIIPWPLTR